MYTGQNTKPDWIKYGFGAFSFFVGCIFATFWWVHYSNGYSDSLGLVLLANLICLIVFCLTVKITLGLAPDNSDIGYIRIFSIYSLTGASLMGLGSFLDVLLQLL